MGGVRRLIIWTLSALAATSLAGRAAGNEAKIHVLLVGDTNDPQIGQSVEADLGGMKSVFASNVVERQLRITTLSGHRVTSRQILQAVGSLAIQPGRDTVVFYFSGHGAFDRGTNEQFLYPARRALYRSEVRKAIQQLQPRLTVLLTDTCSVYVERPPAVMAPAPAEETSPLFQALFLEPRGLVDISATRPGEEARGDTNGGYFSTVLRMSLFMHSHERITWAQVLEEVNAEVPKQYFDAQQTAYALSALPGAGVPADNATGGAQGWRFGVVAVVTPRSQSLGGVEVTQVYPNSPGMRLRMSGENGSYRLVPGRDVITHVNGQPVPTYEQYHLAVRNSPTRIVLRVHDLSEGTSRGYETELLGGASPVRFGVSVQSTARSAQLGGVEVAQVMDGFPGMSLRNLRDGTVRALAVGRDVITHINEKPIASYEQFRSAVADSPRRMLLRVHDLQTGSADDYEVYIAGARGGRFGVSTWPTPRAVAAGGVEVMQVLPGMPGESVRRRDGGSLPLVVGRHVITHVNGQPVTNYPDYVRAVSQSPREMTLRVHDLQSGAMDDCEVTLQD